MRVKNVNCNREAGCTSSVWLDHWKKFSCQPIPTYCPEENCLNSPEAGVLVQLADSSDDTWYVVPLCLSHNGATNRTLEIRDFITLVSADACQTCMEKRP